eukprot:s2029_g3.t1
MAAKRPHADNADAVERALPAKRRPGTVQAVLVDFDATLTVREEIPAWRLFPEKGGFDREVDVTWLRARGFGGEERIRGLENMFRRLEEADVELHVVSWADRDVIERALSLLGLLTHFKSIAGVQQLGEHSGKAAFIQTLISEKSLKRHQVLFIDDQQKNVDAVAEVCLTHKTRGRGLTTTEMDSIVQQATATTNDVDQQQNGYLTAQAPQNEAMAMADQEATLAQCQPSSHCCYVAAKRGTCAKLISSLAMGLTGFRLLLRASQPDPQAQCIRTVPLPAHLRSLILTRSNDECHISSKISVRRRQQLWSCPMVRLSMSRRAVVMVQEDFDAKLPLVPLETYLQQHPSSQVLGPEAVTYVLSASWGRSRLGTIRAAQLKRLMAGHDRRCRFVRLASYNQAGWPFRRPEKEHFEVIKSACRICHSLDDCPDDPLVAPCRCDGSLRYVHNSCQQAWLSHRRGLSDFTCELCRANLACRLTMATRLQVVSVFLASVLLWWAQIGSAWQAAQLAGRLILASWRNVGRVGHLFGGSAHPPVPPAALVVLCQDFAHCSAQRLVISVLTALLALNLFRFLQRPLTFVCEDLLAKICTVKIGGCVLVLLHEVIWVLPAVKRVAPYSAWCALGNTLLMDTIVLAFLKVPREDRCGRQAACRVLHAAVSLTSDFLPFAAVFFLWLASLGMVIAASLVPCMALLLHEAVRDLRRRRQQHGTLQMAVFVLCSAVRVMSSFSAGELKDKDILAIWMERGSLALWLVLEAAVFFDVSIVRRGVSCARDGTSQVLWSIACVGQITLVACSLVNPSTTPPGEGCRGVKIFPVFPSPRRQGTSESSTVWLWRLREALAGSCRGSTATTLQVTALMLMLVCYWSIHAPVLTGWFRRTRQAMVQALTHIDPSQVIFFDHPCHSNSSNQKWTLGTCAVFAAVFVSRALRGLSIGSPAVAQVPAERRLTFAAIDAANAESSRRVKTPINRINRSACDVLATQLQMPVCEHLSSQFSSFAFPPRFVWMEDIDDVLQRWQSLKPDGAVFRAECLDDAVSMVSNIISESGAERCLQRKALMLLRPDSEINVPLMIQLLQIDESFEFSEVKKSFTTSQHPPAQSAVVYFPYFWQAMQELQMRLFPREGRAPIAIEAASFRDAVLDLAAAGSLTTAGFADLIVVSQKDSMDHRAWDRLLEAAHFLVEQERPKTAERQPQTSAETLQQMTCSHKPIHMAILATILFTWLFELCEDYCRGNKAALIRSVRDVLGCSSREAFVHLAAAHWDLEGALRHYDLQSKLNTLDALEACRPDASGWNSHAAKLRKAERDCPICACDFCIGSEPIVTSCCFKAICAHCVAVLVAAGSTDGILLCPFCRQSSDVPTGTQKTSSDQV